MRCIYCHNSQLISGSEQSEIINESDFFSFLKKRQNIIKGVCITGGEPTLNVDLPSFIDTIKNMNFNVKLDTNGLKPQVLYELISDRLIDMVAMDIKGPKNKYPQIAEISIDMTKNIERSIEIILNSNIDYEFRTTVPSGLFTADDMKAIGEWIYGAKAYFLQCFKQSENVPCSLLKSPSHEELSLLLDAVKPFVPNSKLRGID